MSHAAQCCQYIDVEVFSCSSTAQCRRLLSRDVRHHAFDRQRLRANALDGIRALVGALARSARSVERRTGVTTAQFFVLRQLAERDGLSLGEIAERTLTRQSTVSVVVARLEEHGLVRRDRADDDRRRLELSLTAAGRRLLARAPVPTTGRLLAGTRRVDERTTPIAVDRPGRAARRARTRVAGRRHVVRRLSPLRNDEMESKAPVMLRSVRSLLERAGISSAESNGTGSDARARQQRLIIDAILLGVVGAVGAQAFMFALRWATRLFVNDVAGYLAPGLAE